MRLIAVTILYIVSFLMVPPFRRGGTGISAGQFIAVISPLVLALYLNVSHLAVSIRQMLSEEENSFSVLVASIFSLILLILGAYFSWLLSHTLR